MAGDASQLVEIIAPMTARGAVDIHLAGCFPAAQGID